MLVRTGGFIGHDPEETRVTASGVWSLEEAIRRQNDKNWGNYTAELVLDTETIWTPAAYALDVSSNSTAAYGVNRFFTTADATSHDIYIGFTLKGTNSSFYKDMTIAGVEIKFGSTTETYRDTSWSGWQTTTTQPASNVIPVYDFTYTAVTTGSTANRWNIDGSGTASSHTGMANGIITSPDFDSDLIGQLSGADYLYVEASGMSNTDEVWLKKTITPAIGDEITIKIANYYNTSSTGAYSTVVQNCMQILVT